MITQPELRLYVQDAVNENFELTVGPVSEASILLDEPPVLQTDSAAVSTLVEQEFVHNMPLKRAELSVTDRIDPGDSVHIPKSRPGQFSANGQRSNANYFVVDGVSANFGATIGGFVETLGGAIPAFTAQGGTNGLVSVDAMQEFRIQTSSYPAEFGRTLGAQIAIVTKSGTTGQSQRMLYRNSKCICHRQPVRSCR